MTTETKTKKKQTILYVRMGWCCFNSRQDLGIPSSQCFVGYFPLGIFGAF